MNGHNRVSAPQLSVFRQVFSPVLMVLLSLAFIVLTYSAIQFQAQLEQSRAASSDIRIWTIAQTEVEHKNLLLAVSKLKSKQETVRNQPVPAIDIANLAAQLSIAFDVYYSRIGVFQFVVGSEDISDDARADLTTLIQERDRLAEMFDNMDPVDPTQLLQFETALETLETLNRRVVLDALAFFVSKAEALRNDEILMWKKFSRVSFALLMIMAAALYIAVTLHRKMVKQLVQIKAQTVNMKLVYEASMQAVVVTDNTGQIQLINSAAERAFGYTKAEAQGRNIAEIMGPGHCLPRHHQGMQRFRETGTGASIGQGIRRVTSLRRDGTEFPVELSITSETDLLGKEIFIAFIRDVSVQIAYEKNLRAARDEARRHAAAKTMFLATMSHEMRTPLHGLLASLDLIVDNDLDGPNLELVKTARNCGLRTLHQINDVLELTQIGEFKEPPTPFVPARIVSGIMDELRALAQNRGNNVFLNVTGASSEDIWIGQPQTFARIIYNLVGNALKFTENGSVTISLAFSSQLATTPRLRVIVKDDGIGISTEDQAHLFDLFYTADADQTMVQRTSTGLGLPIALAGVHKLGGKLDVESALGVGSTFSFEIPLTAPQDNQCLSLQTSGTLQRVGFGLCCLVVDDNDVNLALTAQMLRRLGCDVVSCESGEKAVSAAVKQAFDVIFMDLNMPGGMSGTEATSKIRVQEATKNAPTTAVILALTADKTFDMSKALTMGGMDGVLLKPVQLLELQQVLSRFSPRNVKGAAPSDPAPAEMAGNDFSDLFDLIGKPHSIRLLNGVLDDTDAALKAIREQQADAVDHLHRATGSTAAVGLLELSQHLRDAEDLASAGADKALLALLATIETCAKQANNQIKHSIEQCSI